MLSAAQHRKRLLRLGFPVLSLLLLGLAACAQPEDSAQSPFVTATRQEFAAGYGEIAARYLEPVSIAALAVSGMEQLQALDPKLKLSRHGSRIHLAYEGSQGADVAAPEGEDPAAWALATSEVLEAARSLSAPLREADLETLYDAVFTGALKNLDPYTRYASAAAAREQRGQRDGFGGIGITVKQDGKDVRVLSVLADGPSAKAGIVPDDLILEIDGKGIGDLPLDSVIDRLRGPIGSKVDISLIGVKDGKPHDLAVARALIVPPTVTFARHGDIAEFKVTSFNADTTTSLERELRRASEEMGKDLHGVVLDLRDNPGGLLDQAVTVSELFLRHGRILTTSGRNPDSNQTFDADGHDLLHGLPLALLVNHGTASAAEVVAAALQDQGRAVVVGTASYGKGTVQTVHELPNTGELILTWSRIHAPSGYVLNEVGVIPNVCTSRGALDGPDTVAAVINSVRNGRLQTAAARLSLRLNGRPNKFETRWLRASCPSRHGEGAVDLEIAERLIDDRTLFARAVQPPSPEVARRE